MGGLTLSVVIAALAMNVAPNQRAFDRAAAISEASIRFGLPVSWIESVIRVESGTEGGLSDEPIRSTKGAMGIMQIMPDTWQELRGQFALGPDPDNIRDNVIAGAGYLRAMYDRFGYPGLFAAYNAGPARFARDLMTGQILPAETRNYRQRVLSLLPAQTSVASDPQPALNRRSFGASILRAASANGVFFQANVIAATPSQDESQLFIQTGGSFGATDTATATADSP